MITIDLVFPVKCIVENKRYTQLNEILEFNSTLLESDTAEINLEITE